MSMATIINQATQIYDTYYSMYDTYIIEPGGSFVFLGMDSYYDPMYYYPYQEVYLNGEIRATFTQNADAIVGDCCMLHLYLSNSTIILQNANINLNGNHQYSTHYHDEYSYYEPTRLDLYSSTLEMNGGRISVTGSMHGEDNIYSTYSTVTLRGTEVICRNFNMSSTDVFLRDVIFTNTANIDIYGGTFEAYNSIFSTAVYLQGNVAWSGSNNYFSSRNTIYCTVKSAADLEAVFDFVGGSSAENPYVSICVSGEADFTYRDSLVPAEKDGFSIRIAEVGTGSTVTIEEGSSLHSSCGMGCYVYGTLKAEFSTVADAIVSTEVGYEDYIIANGGVMDFTRANINLANSSSALTVQKGGMLRVTEAGINTGYGFTVNDGATVEITDANITGKFKLKDGSKGKITDSTIEKLTLSLVSDVEIKGCDLSSTVFEFTDLAAGSMLDLSGNYWGTNDREVIEKRLGDYAGLVYLGELEGEYTGTRTYTVTNTADSGEGSLRWAIEQANAYEGTERTEIVFDESLAGSTIELLSDLTVTARTSMVNFAENPVSVTGAALITSAELILQNMVLEQLIVTGGVPVIGSGNVLTGKGDALRIDHMSAYLGLLEVSMLEQGAYIGLGSTVSDGMLRAEHLGLEYHVTGSSVLPGTVTVDVGETLVLDSGSVLDWTYYNRNENNSTYYTQLYVDGTLKGEGATLGGANAGYLYVRNGAIVDLKDTDVLLKSKNNNNLALNGSCKFRMDGGSLDARLYTIWSTNKNAEILLKDVEINNTVDIYYGQYLFDGCVINSPIEFGYVSSSSNTSVDIRNCVFNVGLSDIEYSDLAYITGGNNSFASDMIADINIYAWGTSSNFDFEKLNSLVGSVESVSPYINISGYTNCEMNLIAFDACERMEYRVKEPTADSSYPYFYVNNQCVLNIEEGACLGISGGGQTLYYDSYMGYYPPQELSYFVDSEDYYYYYENVYAGVMVYGQIKAEFAGNADAIVTNEDRVRICVSGSNGISLKNANVRMTGQDNDLHVKYGGNIQADGGTIDITNGLHVEEGGSAVLSNLTLSADVYCAGALTLTDSRVESAITITGGTAVITGTTGLTELSISAGVDSVTLTDNDFSNTVFNIDSSVVLDLTGNYWGGLTDVDEIRSRYGLGSNVIVNSALEDSGNIQEFVFSVTNTADSGDGSLRQAVSKANAYTGSEVVRINISAALAGREISLGSNLSLNNKCIITGPTLNPLVLKGATLIANSEVSLKNITLPTLRLTGEAVVECESVVCTAERAIELTGWSGEADFSGVRATHSSAYVGISGLIAGDTALCALSTSFRGGYALYGATTIDEGAELTLADGVKLNMGTYQLIICGKLSQNNSVAANGLYSSGKACNVVVADGGELSLVNSHFVSANNSLRPMGSLAVESGGQLSLADSNVTVATFSVAGSAEMDGGTINANSATVKSGGSFAGTSVLIEHEFTAERGASLSMKDCVVGENLNISCTASLEKVSCARLVLGAGAAISSTGVGVTMTEEEALRLDGWSGSTEALFKSFTWNAIADGAYVGICGTIGGNSTFGILPTALRSGGYKLSGATTIAASTTTTLEEGVIWNLNSQELRIDGTLSIENENYAQALMSDSSAGVVIGDNGKLVLTNSGISFRQAGGSSVGKLTVNGGELVATDSVLICADIIVNSGKADLSGGTVDARNTEVKSGASLTALGSNFTASLTGADGSELSLKNCSLAGTLAVGGKAELSSVTCGTLTLSSGSELVTDAVGVTLTGQNAIVLKNWHGSVDDLLDSFNWTATDEQARLGIAGNIAANSTFCALPDTLRGGYVLVDNTTVLVGAAVQLEDGVGWDIDGRNLYIKGALSAANTTARNALFNQDGGGNIYVHDGATVELEKAHISMTTADAKLAGMLYIYSGGELNMTEGNVQAQVVHVYGSVTHSDGRVNCNTYDVYSGGSLVLTDVTHSGNLSLRAGSVGTINRVSINGNFSAKGKVSATDVSCATLIFGGDCDLTVPAGKITMSAREAIRLEDWHGNTAETLGSFAWKAEAEDAYVGIGGQITGNSVFAALPAALPGGYRLSSDVTIVAGAVVTLNEGIAWHADGKTLRVSGELRSVNETSIKALAWNNGAVIVQGGGKLLLARADADFGGGNSALMGTVNVSSGGMLSLSESELRVKTLTLAGSLALAENASLCVSDFRVNRNSSISSVDSRIEGNVYAKEAANLSFIRSEITGTLQAAPGAYLESFTCQTLELSTLTDLTVAGTGVTLTGAQALRLNSVCGGVSEALQLYKWNFADENSYVGLLGNLTADTTYTALPENRYTGGYKLVEQLTVGAGVTMSIGAGSKWNLNGCTLAVRGTVEINGEEEAPVELGSGKITLYEGSVLTSENVQSAAYVSVSGGAEISLTNTTLSGVNLTRDSVANLSGCVLAGQSTISLAADATISGNDLSKATIVLADTDERGVVDLSGNYWGTLDLLEITSRIRNYSEERVLISSILSSPPTQEFCFDAVMFGHHRLSDDATSLVLTFNRSVDANSVTAESLGLFDAEGNAVTGVTYEVNDNKVVLHFSPLSIGKYTVKATDKLLDVEGHSFSQSDNFANGIEYNCLEIGAPRVLLFRSNSTVTDVFSYVDLFFDQDMDSATISTDSVHLIGPDGKQVEFTHSLMAGMAGNIFYRFYFDPVTVKGAYQVQVDSSVRNDLGVAMDGGYVREVYVAAPDLVVQPDISYTDSTLGRYTTISYSVANAGDAMTPGTWTDSIYLCKTETWDADKAILFGRVNRTTALAEGESYTAQVRSLLGDLDFGSYYIFVKTDDSGRLSEADEANNISSTGKMINIGVPEISLSHADTQQLASANERLCYSFTPTEGGSFILSVDDPRASVTVSTMANGGVAINKKVAIEGVNNSVFSAKAGETYYITIKGGQDTTYTTEVQKSEFGIYDSSFSYLAAGHASTLSLLGAAFSDGMLVYVEDENGVRYNADKITIIDSCQASVTFNLPEGLSNGTELTLYVQNELGDVEFLNQPLRIASFSDVVELEFSKMNGEKHVGRVGWVWKADLFAENKAGYDVSNAIILITDTAEDFALFYDYDDAKARDRSALLLLGGADALSPEVLTAGEKSKLGIYIRNYRSGEGAIQAWLLNPSSTSVITEEMWKKIAAALRPAQCGDVQWFVWWTNIQPRIGDSIGDLCRFIQTVQSLVQQKNQTSVAQLVGDFMQEYPDYVPSLAVYGALINDKGTAAEGFEVNVYQIVNGEKILIDTAYTDAKGQYSLYGLQANTEYLITSGFYFYDKDGKLTDTASFRTSDTDFEWNATLITSGELVHTESYSRLTDDGQGNIYKTYIEGNELVLSYEKNGKKQRVVITRGEELRNGAIYYGDVKDAFIVAWEEGMNEAACVKLRMVKNINGKLYFSEIYDIDTPDIEERLHDVFMREDGTIVAITEAYDSTTNYLSFNEIGDADSISWSDSSDSKLSMLDTSGVLDNSEAHYSLELPFIPIAFAVDIKQGVDVADDKLSAEFERGLSISCSSTENADYVVLFYNGSSENWTTEWKYEVSMEYEAKFYAWYDCVEKRPFSKQTEMELTASAELSHDKGLLKWLYIVLPVFAQNAERGIEILERLLNIEIDLGFGVKAYFSGGSNGLTGGLEAALYGGISRSKKEAIFDFNVSVKGSLGGEFQWVFGQDVDFDVKVGLEASAAGVIRVFGQEAYFGAGFTYDNEEGFDNYLSFGFDGKIDKPNKTAAYVYQNEVKGINEKTYAFSGNSPSSYSPSEATSAYVYVNSIGGISVQFFDAQNSATIGDEVNVRFDSELFCGDTNIVYLSSATDGAGNVFLAAEGFYISEEDYEEYQMSGGEVTFGDLMQRKHCIESAIIDADGNAFLLDQTRLQSFSWNGDEYDVTKQTSEVEVYSMENELSMVWISEATGCKQIYVSFLDNAVWESPTMLFSTDGDIANCYINEIENSFYVTFDVTHELSCGTVTTTAMVYNWVDSQWVFDERLNTERAVELYNGYISHNVAPELVVQEPVISKAGEGLLNFYLSWQAVDNCTYELTLDDKVYTLGSDTEFKQTISDGAHSYSLKAISGAGLTTVSDIYSFYRDATAPIINNVKSYCSVAGGGTILHLSWQSAEDCAIVVTVDGVSYTVSDGSSLDVPVSNGSHSYRIVASDASGNEAVFDGSLYFDDTRPVVELLSPSTSIVDAGRSLVVFRWDGEAGLRYSLTVDGVVYESTSDREMEVLLADGEHFYSLTATNFAGVSTTVSGSLMTDTVAPELSLKVVSLNKASEGKLAVTFSWTNNEDAELILHVGGQTVNVTGLSSKTFILDDGLNSASLRATDKAGNESEQCTSFRLDCSAPELSLNKPSVFRSGNDYKVQFSWNAADSSSLSHVLYVNGIAVYSGKNKSHTMLLSTDITSWRVVSTDRNGNVTEVSGNDSIKMPVHLSNAEIQTSGVSGKDGYMSITLSWSSSVASSYEVWINGKKMTTTTSTSYTTELEDGYYSYRIKAVENGRESNILQGSGSYDATAPLIHLKPCKIEQLNANEYEVMFAWNSSEKATYKLILGNGEVYENITATQKTLVLPAGNYSYTIEARDANGNIAYSATEDVQVRSEIAISVLQEPLITKIAAGKTSITFSWTCDDVNATFEFVFDGKTYDVGRELTFTIDDISDGDYQYKLVTTSGAGVSGEIEGELTLDTTGPIVKIQSVTQEVGEQNVPTITFEWESDENATYNLEIDGELVAEGLTDEFFTYRFEDGVTNGNHYCRILATDELGNQSASEEFSFGVDSAAPVISDIQLEPESNGDGTSSVVLRWNSDDYDADVYISIDGGMLQSPIIDGYYGESGLKDGYHSYSIYAVDEYNNVSGTITGTFETDGTGPKLINLSANSVQGNMYRISWKFNESCTYTLSINGRWVYFDSLSPSATHTTGELSPGSYTYTIFATDKFGNQTEWENSFVILPPKKDEEIQGGESADLMTLLTAKGEFLMNYLSSEACPNTDEPETLPHDSFNSFDPNEFYGPAGYGKENWIKPQEMQFQIMCENIPEENIAHAAMVTIKHKIDEAYDYSTFRLGNMMMGGNYIEVLTDVTSYKARLDWTDTLGIWVDVNVFFDADTGEVTWEFTAIDPATGSIMSDPFKGLLAPNFNPPEGDGMVYYYIEPKSTTKTGTTASSQASIVFDYNEPILTPVLTYTFDADAPVATVQALAAESDSRYIMVNWEGSDKGSGLAGFNVYVSIDGEPWTLWQESITATGALYAVAEGEHTYAFFAQGMDYAGNAETVTELVMAEAATKSNYTPRSTELSVSSLSATREGALLTLQLVFNEAAECADWAGALQLLAPSGSIDLSKGVFRYDSVGNVLTWQGDISGIAEGETLHVRINSGLVTDAEGLPLGGDFTPSFSLPVTMTAAGAAYAAPCLTDYNNDGLLDLLVGEVSNGVGKVRLYLNEGTAEVAQFSTFSYLTTVEDTALAVTAEGCQGAIVRLADLTGDGVAELLVGLADGTVRMYTAADGGKWQDAGLLSCTVGGAEQLVSVGARAAIEVCDFNADGRTDLLVGTGTGNVVLYLDTATEGAAVFDGGQFLHDCDGSIRAASRASVTVADVDGDGLTDLLVGASDGIIRFYRNEGSNELPLFGKPVNIQSGDSLLDFSGETSRVRLSAADVDGDGFVDLMVGMADGSIRVLHGVNNSIPVGSVHAGDNPLYLVENVNVLVQGGGLLISWDAVDGESVSYEVSYCVSGQAESVIVPTSATSATLQLPDGSYELRVRAITQGGTGPWSEFATATIDTVAPVVPGLPQTAVGENGSAVLSWSATDSVTSYIIRYKSVGASSWQTISTESTSVSLTNLPGGDIVWQVCSIDAAGNTSVWSDESIFASTGTIPTLTTHWAGGMLFDADGNIIGGYADVNKNGTGDSSLCWAAAASNILAWWQQQYPTGSALNGVPQSAGDIYALFCNSWENVAGSEQYAFNWWLAGEEGSSSYKRFHTSYYCGNDDDGGWYSDYYNGANIANHTAQVSLQGVEVADISRAWTGIYNAGGMLALGVFRSISGSSLTGGHSLTLWGFCENEDGLIEQIYVTDSDDKTTSILTLNVEVDADSKLYRISEGQEGLSGYYVGSYTYLKAGGMSPDGSTTEQAESLSLSSANDGSGQYSSSVLNWVGAGDSVDYYSITATGDGTYRLNIDTSTLETAVRVSVGVLNAQGEFEVTEELLLTPDSAQGTLPGVAAVEGDKLYVKVESLAPENGGFYELNVDATVPSGGTGLVTQNNSSAVATESSADGETHRGWVGAGDVCDFYRVQMSAEGSLSFALSELESSARLRIYSERADGSLAQLDSRMVKSGSALEHTLSLTDGTYYIEIASADGGLGACNTSYSLTLQKEEAEADKRDKSDIAIV